MLLVASSCSCRRFAFGAIEWEARLDAIQVTEGVSPPLALTRFSGPLSFAERSRKSEHERLQSNSG